jgi:hypothetical protein
MLHQRVICFEYRHADSPVEKLFGQNQQGTIIQLKVPVKTDALRRERSASCRRRSARPKKRKRMRC